MYFLSLFAKLNINIFYTSGQIVNRSIEVSVKMLYTFLEHLASGGYYRQIGMVMGVAKCTAINYCRKAANFFIFYVIQLFITFIYLYVADERLELSCSLDTANGEKQVVLYIDGFILKIQRPDRAGDAYFCGRVGKSCDSLNVQYVVDKLGRIRHIVSGISGAAHDKTAISWSQEFRQFLDELPCNYVVLGDPAYRGYHEKVITPFVGHNLNEYQVAYNNACTRLRQIVERTIGASQLKWRIQQLKDNHIPAKSGVVYASQCSIAAAVLHNRFTNCL